MGKIHKKKPKKSGKTEETKSTPTIDERLEEILLNKKDIIDDDVKSTKSLHSIKNQLGIKQLSKINKTKLKRNMLMKKIGVVKNDKKVVKNILSNDNLPSLTWLSASTANKIKVQETKKKPIPKVSKRKKNLIEGVRLYKNVIGNKDFKEDPIGSVLQQVKLRLDNSNL